MSFNNEELQRLVQQQLLLQQQLMQQQMQQQELYNIQQQQLEQQGDEADVAGGSVDMGGVGVDGHRTDEMMGSLEHQQQQEQAHHEHHHRQQQRLFSATEFDQGAQDHNDAQNQVDGEEEEEFVVLQSSEGARRIPPSALDNPDVKNFIYTLFVEVYKERIGSAHMKHRLPKHVMDAGRANTSCSRVFRCRFVVASAE
jgi:hypothetical protein